MAADHAGFVLKRTLVDNLRALGHEVLDLGTHDPAPSDYPDHAEALARSVLAGQVERGVLVCGSGVGAAMAANKIPGIYAGLCHDTYSAHQGVEHDRMNVIALGSRVVGEALALELVQAFLAAQVSPEERHARRFEKVKRLEARGGAGLGERS